MAKATHDKKVWEDFWDENKNIDQVYENSDRIIDQIHKLGPVENKWIMEIGAGSGRDSFKLLDEGAKIIFLDYADNSLKLIKEIAAKKGQSVICVQGDAFHLPFKTDVIDVVFHQGLLEHFTNPQDLLAENYRVVKQGGFAITDVPQKYHPYTAVKHILMWMNKWFAGWETEFSKPQLVGLYKNVGFAIHNCYGDWMRPSFFYRAAREAFKKIGIKLPQYPKSILGLGKVRDAIGNQLKKSSLSFYTFMDLGVIGVKPEKESGEGNA